MACTALFRITATECERCLNVTAAAGGGVRVPNDVRGGGTYLAECLGVFEFSEMKSVENRFLEAKESFTNRYDLTMAQWEDLVMRQQHCGSMPSPELFFLVE